MKESIERLNRDPIAQMDAEDRFVFLSAPKACSPVFRLRTKQPGEWPTVGERERPGYSGKARVVASPDTGWDYTAGRITRAGRPQ